ncbi:hypothetical protein BCR34DRAFT_184420 [Clohesyomyces aquaticus]|uniref:Uncharacterized protein n=1 Tax=Clohesyomyces aquaticus TaxID=1231657 RepID=A0A1Y1YE33_9PLEO|nr:hypothetical protein BCR34DRAFT_184420 [Clohesyomyces aquaticus]
MNVDRKEIFGEIELRMASPIPAKPNNLSILLGHPRRRESTSNFIRIAKFYLEVLNFIVVGRLHPCLLKPDLARSRVLMQKPRKVAKTRSLFDRLRGKARLSRDTSVESALSATQHVPPMVEGFSNSLNSGKLSNFLVWFYYFDLVELPESPAQWYKPIPSMEMRSWIALGEYIHSQPDIGLDLIILDSICDRMHLQNAMVHGCLIQLADPEKMAWTQLATALRHAKQERKTQIGTLNLVWSHLRDIQRLLIQLKPIQTPSLRIGIH